MKRFWAILCAVALSSTMVMTTSTAATAEARVKNTFRVTTDQLVLTARPSGGYFGVLTVTATYTGKQASVSSPTITLVPLANFALGPFTGAGACFPVSGVIRCTANGIYVKDQPQTFTIGFTGFAAPAAQARLATGGSIQLSVGLEPSGKSGTAQLDGILAAADGSIANPVPYVFAAAPDLAIVSSNVVSGNGFLTVAVTVRDLNDAFNFGGSVMPAVPGVSLTFFSVSPPAMCFGTTCQLSGGALFEGGERSIQVTYTVSGLPGTHAGTFTAAILNTVAGVPGPDDVNPADNTINFTVTIPATIPVTIP